MVSTELKNTPWVICRIKNELYGIPTTYVREMVKTPHVTHVPRVSPHVRGVINLRGNIIPLIDLRALLGITAAAEESKALIENLAQRRQDHINWVENLEKSVNDNTTFTGQLDPHKCAFGLWYDSYKADNTLLDSILRRFDKPHKAIHALGTKVKSLQSTGLHDQAKALIKKAKENELSDLLNHFASAIDTIQNNSLEVAVVLIHENRNLAVTVDYVVSVETLNQDTFDDPPIGNSDNTDTLLCGSARRHKTDELLMLLDGMTLIRETVEKSQLPT